MADTEMICYSGIYGAYRMSAESLVGKWKLFVAILRSLWAALAGIVLGGAAVMTWVHVTNGDIKFLKDTNAQTVRKLEITNERIGNLELDIMIKLSDVKADVKVIREILEERKKEK